MHSKAGWLGSCAGCDSPPALRGVSPGERLAHVDSCKLPGALVADARRLLLSFSALGSGRICFVSCLQCCSIPSAAFNVLLCVLTRPLIHPGHRIHRGTTLAVERGKCMMGAIGLRCCLDLSRSGPGLRALSYSWTSVEGQLRGSSGAAGIHGAELARGGLSRCLAGWAQRAAWPHPTHGQASGPGWQAGGLVLRLYACSYWVAACPPVLGWLLS
ncbi:hypothetical protein V8C86DRAFT_941642 [Haematococcus lacustris]